MKKYPLILYYRLKICSLNKKIKERYDYYAYISSTSSKNFEFDRLVEEDIVEYKKNIYKIKRKMCNVR